MYIPGCVGTWGRDLPGWNFVRTFIRKSCLSKAKDILQPASEHSFTNSYTLYHLHAINMKPGPTLGLFGAP